MFGEAHAQTRAPVMRPRPAHAPATSIPDFTIEPQLPEPEEPPRIGPHGRDVGEIVLAVMAGGANSNRVLDGGDAGQRKRSDGMLLAIEAGLRVNRHLVLGFHVARSTIEQTRASIDDMNRDTFYDYSVSLVEYGLTAKLMWGPAWFSPWFGVINAEPDNEYEENGSDRAFGATLGVDLLPFNENHYLSAFARITASRLFVDAAEPDSLGFGLAWHYR